MVSKKVSLDATRKIFITSQLSIKLLHKDKVRSCDKMQIILRHKKIINSMDLVKYYIHNII